MDYQQENMIDDGLKDLLIGSRVDGEQIRLPLSDRPSVKGKDGRSVWARFSDWIFDGILPDTQPNYYGDGDSEEKKIERQREVAIKARGGKPFIDKEMAAAERLAADLMLGFADEGKMPGYVDPAEQVADDLMLELARAAIADPKASPEEKEQAVETIGRRAIKQMVEKQETEADIASISGGNGLVRRVVSLHADGKQEEEIGSELRAGGWDYSKADKKLFDRLQAEIEILLDEGEFGRAKSLTLARLNLMKNGGAADVNMTPYDTLLDAYIQADTANLTRFDAFSIAGTDAFLSTIRGVGRLTGVGYITPKDKDILEKMAAESYGKHPITSFAGSFAGGFVDPLFFGISMAAAKAPITSAQRLRYVDDLVARGTPKTIATQMGKKATTETIATARLAKHFLNRGMSLRAAQAAGGLVWNIADAGITNGLAEGVVAAGEGGSATDIALRSITGAGVGMTMGVVLDRAFRGIDKVSRVISRRVPGVTAGKIDLAVDYAAAQGPDGKEMSEQIRTLVTRLEQASDQMGRKLTDAEARDIAAATGLDLDEIATLRGQQIKDLKDRSGLDEKGRPFDDVEREAIRKGILKDSPPEPTPEQRKAQSKAADEEVRKQAEKAEAEDAAARKREQEAGIDAKVGQYRRMSPDELKSARDGFEDLPDGERSVAKKAIVQVENERRTPSKDFPARLSLDDLAALEAPSADLESPDAIDLEASMKFQKGNIETIDHRGDDFVKVRVPIEELEIRREDMNIESEPEVDLYRGMNPQTRPPIAAGPPADGSMSPGKTMLLADGSRRATAARLNGEAEVVAYVPAWYADERGFTNLPPHLREAAQKADGEKPKAKKPTKKPEIIDRTPEGFGPGEPEPQPKGAPDGQAEPTTGTRPTDKPEPANDGDIPSPRSNEPDRGGPEVEAANRGRAGGERDRGTGGDGGRVGESDIERANREITEARKAQRAIDDARKLGESREESAASKQARELELQEKLQSGKYEEMPTNMDDMRVFLAKSSADEPVDPRQRKAMEEIIAKAEKIDKAKPSKPRKKSTSKKPAKLPVMRLAPSTKAFVADMEKIIGKPSTGRVSMVEVSGDGKTAAFISHGAVIESDSTPWGSKWAEDGIYDTNGEDLVSTNKVVPNYKDLFDPKPNQIEFDDVEAQDIVRVARKLKAINGPDATGVVSVNPDGSIGFSTTSPGVGSVLIGVKDGARPIGMVDGAELERIARAFQRGDSGRFSIAVAKVTGKSEPDLSGASMFVFRGDRMRAVVSGLDPSKGGRSERVPADIGGKAEINAKGIDGRIPEPDQPDRVGVPGRNTGTEFTTPDGITGNTLDSIKGVPGDQRELQYNAGPNSGVDPGLEQPKNPDWVYQPATTRRGKKSLGRIKSDPKGMKYGVRTIAEQFSRDLNLFVRQTREQSSAKNPAHYMQRPHMVRTRSASEPNWMFHEQGHAMSSIVREANPKFLQDFKEDLIELARWPGSMASKISAEEGFAEFVRRSITAPGRIADWEPSSRIMSALESVNPKIVDSMRDAARAFAAHMERPIDARWRSVQNDTKARPFSPGRVISRALVDYVSRGFAPELAVRRVMVEVRKDAASMTKGWKKVAKFEEGIKNSAGDMIPTYQSLNHIGQMVNIAVEGPGKVAAGKPTGMRVHATVVPESLLGTMFDRPRGLIGDEGVPAMLGESERAMLEAAGFNVPGEPKQHGEVVVLAKKSLADAIKPITKERWSEFETYAQVKATVARIKARAEQGRSFPYQTQGEGVSPIDLIQLVKKSEKDNPEWVGVFKDLEEIANATLLLNVMAGELSAADAIKIKNAFEHYIPLTRQGEGGARAIRSGATTAPSANIRRSNGSVNPAEPLLIAMSRKIDDAVNAYYWNRFALSPIVFSEMTRANPDVPRSAKIAADQMAIRLHLDTKKMATATPDEVRKSIYDYIVQQVQQGNELFNIDPEMLASFTPEDIGIVDGFDLWRKVPPKAVNVIAPNIRGQRVYYQILDENLYRIFSEGGDGANAIARISETAFGSATDSLKMQITNSFVFAYRSLARDPLTAIMFGKDPEAMVPMFYHAVGAVAMLTKRDVDSLVSPELLSRVFRQVTPEDFAARRSKSMEMLAEGIVPRGWRDMNALSKGLSAPGVAFRILMKPIELKQILTGQRWLASTMETAPRLGAFIMAKRRGLNDEAAQLAADTVTGNFSERPQSASAHSIYRTAGFLNPAFQIFGQTAKIALDPVPARAVAKAATISGNVAFWTSVAWAVNRLVSSEDDRKRNAERTEQERLTHMDIKGLRVPFDYGILGGVQSYTWNALDEIDGQPGVSGDQIARKILSEVLPHTSLNPLELAPMTLKAGAEASMGVSLYRESTIEPPFMQFLEPPERYFDTTPDLYRWVGRMTNSSPVRIQYFARNGLGVQLDDMVRLLDRVDEGLELDELASLPEIGRAFSREPVGWDSRSVRDAGDLSRKYDRLRTRAKRMMQNPDIDREAVSEIIAVLNKLQPVKDAMLEVQRLYDASKYAKQGNRELSKELKRRMVEVAREGLIQMQKIEDGEK